MRFKSTFAALLIAASALGVASGANGQSLPSYFLDLIETGKGLQVDTNLPTFNGAPDDVFEPGGGGAAQGWAVGDVYGPYKEFSTGCCTPFDLSDNGIAWKEPTGPNYDLLFINPDGNHGTDDFNVFSDIPQAQFGNVLGTGFDFYRECLIPALGFGSASCPVLTTSQSFSQGMNLYGTPLGTLTVKFTDRGDGGSVGVPEPGTWMLLGAGVLLLGGVLSRRPSLKVPSLGASNESLASGA